MINNIMSATPQVAETNHNSNKETDNTGDSFLPILQASFDSPIALDEDYMDNFRCNPPKTTETEENVSYLVSIDEVNKDIKRNYQSVTELINETLENEGIRRYPDFEILVDEDDKLFIDSDRKDKDKIEYILNNNKDIRDTFIEMSENVLQAAMMERTQDFIYNYALDPQNSQRLYNSLYSEEPADTFSLKITENHYTPKLYSYGKESELHVFDDIIAGDFNDLKDIPRELETVSLI